MKLTPKMEEHFLKCCRLLVLMGYSIPVDREKFKNELVESFKKANNKSYRIVFRTRKGSKTFHEEFIQTQWMPYSDENFIRMYWTNYWKQKIEHIDNVIQGLEKSRYQYEKLIEGIQNKDDANRILRKYGKRL